ncbi:MAG TPA: PepSY domain-containing protein [Pseudomonadales bacterium]
MKTTTITTFFAAALGCSALIAADDDVSRDEAERLVEAGTIMSFEDLDKAALALHPGTTIEDTELERENERYVYQVELRGDSSADDDEWDIELDAATGEVLSDSRDN